MVSAMKHYQEKMNYLIRRNGGNCAICGLILFGVREKVDLHHRAHNTAWRRRNYPLFIDSVLNLAACHHDCHMERGGHDPITDYRAERYENYLRRNARIAKWVNCPGDSLRVVW